MFRLLVVLLLTTCLLACVSCLPFNAAALPGGWHYNGDVGRAPNLAIAVSYAIIYPSVLALREDK